MKKINIIEAAMKHSQIVVSVVLLMMVLGAIALMNMPRNEFPDFTIRQGVIVGVYPGATSQEVEEQLTTEVENYLFGYKEINKQKTYSESSEGRMIIYVELNGDVTNADEFWSKLRHGLAELKMILPSGVMALIGTNDFGDTSALLITMTSENKSFREMEDIMKELEADIRKLETVSKIKKYGLQKEKVFIYTNPEKLKEYNLSPTLIMAAFKMQDQFSYAGELDNGELVMPVQLPPRFESVSDIEQQVVYSDPTVNVIRLKDIARVEKKYDEPDNYIRNNKKNTILLSLEMQRGNNIVHFGEDVNNILEKFTEEHKGDVDINVISNQPDVVDHSISHFLKEFIIAIFSVIIVTIILLPLKVASVAAITIPISILITMGIMQAIGLQLEIVSLAGLIVVLGMVVDNAIVVIDNHIEKLDSGQGPWNAAWKAATELFKPVLSATAAIMAAFFPMMFFMSGMARDFVGSFPLTISIALAISLIVAVLLVPFLCYLFIKQGLHDRKRKRRSILDIAQGWYDRALEAAFRHGKLTIFGGVLSIGLALLIFVNLDQLLFPTLDRKQFAVEVYLPEGASLHETEKIIDSLETILMQDKEITNVASFVGNGSPRFHTLYAPHMPAKNYGQILVNTVSEQATIDLLKKYSENYRGHFPNAHVKWKQIALEGFKAPIEIRLSGDNIEDLKTAGQQVTKVLEKNKDFVWIRHDWSNMKRGLSINLDRDKANRLGYTKTMAAMSLMTSLKGLPVTTLWDGDYPIDVVLLNEKQDRDDITDLDNQYIFSPITMESMPLRSISKIEPVWNEGVIVRRNGIRTLTVLADVKMGGIYSAIFADVWPKISTLELPASVSVDFGGEQADSIENFIPLVYSLFASIIIIFFILMFQFKTVRRALLVMSTMLLSLFGVSLGLLVTGYAFSLTAFIGLIGLMGLTVRNGIILVDYGMQLVYHQGYGFKDAAMAAGKRRMRPIFLTSMAAAMGVVPMIISRSLLWGPLGAVICFGLITGMILTLFVLPVLYWKTSSKKMSGNS